MEALKHKRVLATGETVGEGHSVIFFFKKNTAVYTYQKLIEEVTRVPLGIHCHPCCCLNQLPVST